MKPDDVVFVMGDQRISRATYSDRVNRAISVLQAIGIGAGDCIGIAFRNRPQFFELLVASAALQAKALPVAWRLKREELRYLIADSRARIVFYDPDSAPHMLGLPGISLEDYEERLASVRSGDAFDGTRNRIDLELYSSGTTGRPKAIERGVPKTPPVSGSTFLDLLGVGGPGEVHLICGPLYHSQPIGFGTAALNARHRVVMMAGGFDAETCLRTIEQERVTWLTCVPTHFIRMLALPEKLRRSFRLESVRAVLHSAAPCPRDVKLAIMELFPRDTVWEIYGGTEGAMTIISPAEWRARPGSVGRGFPPGAQLRILDADGTDLPAGKTGLIYARSSLPFRYRGAPELDRQTWRGEWYTLGDLGYLDEAGYLFITDRMKDMIITGGANVYPTEVEAVLFNHPAVGDAAVIGVPDPHWGEKVKAIVEPRAETTAEDLIAYCRTHMAHYKCPTSVEFIPQLPRDPNGKIRKRELREKYWAGSGRAV